MDYKDLIAYKANKRGIDSFIHFTNVMNLPSILQYGILPKKFLNDKLIEYSENDVLRLDGYTDATSISVTSPNYKMFYKYRRQNPSKRWAVLVMDAMCVIPLECAYCYTNAANQVITSIPIKNLMTVEAFDKMFAETNAQYSRKRMNLSENEPTDPQAEILVFDEITPKAIKYIFFDDYNTMVQYIPLLDSKNIVYSCDIGVFMPRHDYSFW